jgi:hypothetical protein
VTFVKNRQRYKFCAETFFIAVVFSLSLIGIHFVITRIFKFTNQDSLIILIPVFLISFPAIVYGYHIGFRRYSKIYHNSTHKTKIRTTKKTILELLNSSINISLIVMLTFIGLYLIIIKKSYTFGVVFSLAGAAASVPISNKLYKSLMQKNRNG